MITELRERIIAFISDSALITWLFSIQTEQLIELSVLIYKSVTGTDRFLCRST